MSTQDQQILHTLTYRPHLKWIYFLLVGTAGITAAVLIGFGIFLMLNSKEAGGILIGMGVFLPTLLYFEAQLLVRPLAFSKIFIREAGFTLDRISKVIEIPFSEIEKVTFSSIPYLGGWFKVKAIGKKPVRFTVVLEHSELLLEAIAKGAQQAVPPNKLAKYRLTAITADHSWSRIYERCRAWPIFLAKYVGLPIGLAVAVTFLLISKNLVLSEEFGKISVRIGVLLYRSTFFYGFFTYIAADLFLMNRARARLKGNPQDITRDLVLERKIFLGFTIVFSLLVAWRTISIYQGFSH